MTSFNVDLIPETTGRNLGSLDKRWDLKARNIDFTGTLTGFGLQQWSVINPTPNTETLHLESNTGTGGSLVRMVVRNTSASARTTTAFTNSVIEFGSPLDAEGGVTPLRMYSGPSTNEDYLTCFRKGTLSTPAFAINENGSMVSYTGGFATALFLYASGDAQVRFSIQANGDIFWGPGGSIPTDCGIGRQSPSTLQINNSANSYGNLYLNQLVSTAATGTPPLAVSSSTKVDNLNADLLDGYDWGSPPPGFGATNPSAGQFTELTVSGQVHVNAPEGTPPFTVQSSTPVQFLTVRRCFDAVHDGYINENGSAIKSIKALTGSIAPGARAIIHMVFPVAFPSADYTVTVAVFDSLNPTTPGLRVHRITAQEVTNVDIQIGNESSTEARNGVVHVMAFRTS